MTLGTDTPRTGRRVWKEKPVVLEPPFNWGRAEVIGIAKLGCVYCHGYGLVPEFHGPDEPCNCVFRAIFQICYRRYKECQALAEHVNGVEIEQHRHRIGYRVYSRRLQEYTADFDLVCRRILTPEHYALFRLHFLRGAEWRECCQLLRMDRGSFFHDVYRIMQRAGRVFAELKPYPLYPVADYFAGVVAARGVAAEAA